MQKFVFSLLFIAIFFILPASGQESILKRLETLESKVRTLETENNALKGRVSSLETENNALKGRVSSLETEVNNTVKTRITNLENVSHRLIAGPYQLVMQGDGNLVIYKNGVAIWDSQTVWYRLFGTIPR